MLTVSSKAGFFWFGTCFLSLLYTFFRIPETRVSLHASPFSEFPLIYQNRSFLELDYLFHEKVKARAFRTYPVNSESLIFLSSYPWHEADIPVAELAQADEANINREIVDEKKNISQVEVATLPAAR
jgi:hypothetical protein